MFRLFCMPVQLVLDGMGTPGLPPLSEDSRDLERDLRSGAQWLQSAIAYCKWRAGDSWRKTWRAGQRRSAARWEYLGAVRCLTALLRYDADAGRILPVTPALHPIPAADAREAEFCTRSRAALADDLIRLNPSLYTDKNLLAHLPRPKLARMLCRALDDAAATRPARRRA